MKKFFILTALAATTMMGFTSCEDDKDPVWQQPAEGSFVLNTPVFANEEYVLTPDGSIILTTSQPDYGFTASVTYTVEMKVDANSSDVVTIKPDQPTQAMIRLNDPEIATGICNLLKVEDEAALEAYGAIPVYFRAIAQIGDYENTRVESNWVSFKAIKPYYNIPEPGFIYLVGAPSGWTGPDAMNEAKYENFKLYESKDAIGSQVYSGKFDIKAGEAMFRFYTALTGWDTDSWGSQVDDSPIDEEFTDGKFEAELIKGKGSFNFPNWTGGIMTITVDFSGKSPKVTILEGDHEIAAPADYVYMVGNNAGWAEPSADNEAKYKNWLLADETHDGIYTGTFNMANFTEEALYCRFYQQLTGWGAAQWASAADGSVNVDCALGEAIPTYVGEGCFVVSGVAGKTLTVTLDTNKNTVVFNAE